MTNTICVLGCGGFIGSHITERLLESSNAHIIGIDISSRKIAHLLSNERFSYIEQNVYDNDAVIRHIGECETIISLVALCNPSLYNTIPIEVIESNFTRPLELVKYCADSGKWLIHFSTCEVYGKTIAGMVPGNDIVAENPDYYVLKEDESPMVLGPIGVQRWSYACAKQLLERLIYAYGFEKNLKYTIIRPFNFIGSRMDYIPGIDGEGIPRVLACFIEALLFDKPIKLVDNGTSKRCFTAISDAVDAVMAVLDNREKAIGQIFNVGNPDNEINIAALADIMIQLYKEIVPEKRNANFTIENVSSRDFYGEGYEDSDRRVPDISKAQKLLGWEPKTSLEDALRQAIRAYIETYGS